MKPINLKRVTVSSNGAINFSFSCFTDSKQIIFYEKDFVNSALFNKFTRNQKLQSLSYVSYKSKYKL